MLTRSVIFALLLKVTVTGVSAAQPQYAQCGGINWTGGTTCDPGLTCVYQNDYYSQCLQTSTSSSITTTTTTTTKTSSTSSATSSLQPQYAQCGGINWTGGTKCDTGLTCVYQNDYYSQCLQTSSSSSSSTTTTIRSTTSSASSRTTNSIASSTSTVAGTTTASTTKSSSTSSASSTAQPQYAQCGGINWTGGTTCAAGLTCVYQNDYYSQCLQASSTSSTQASSITSTTSIKASSTTTSISTSTRTSTTSTTSTRSTTTMTTSTISPTSSTSTRTSTSSSTSSNTASPSSGFGPVYKASITHYGAGDSFGSPNCNTNTAACGFYTYPGYSAAVSQNLYGAGPGQGAGPACGTCYLLTGQTDSSGNKLSNAGTSIIVMINNLCPADGNPLCAQNGLSGTNQYGANVNFDLCSDSGAQAAFFGNDGQGLAVGTAQQIDCSAWKGTVVH